MTLLDAIMHECRTKLLRPAILMSLAVYASALIYGAVSGRLERDARTEAIAQQEALIAAKMQRWLSDLESLEQEGVDGGAPPWSGSPMDVVFTSSLAPAPLADFAVGQADLLPYAGAISLWDPDIRLFSRYEFEDPVSLALGAFDLSKAVILVLPVLLIAVCFDVLSAERDAQRLSLIVAQGGQIRSLCWRRLLIRSSVILLLTVLVAFGAFLMNAGPATLADRSAPFLWWAAAAASYATFWVAVIAFVAGKNRRGETNLVILLLAWASLCLILPAALAAVAEALYPAPSRVTYLAASREAEIATELAEPALMQQFALDHPELVVDDEADMPGYVRTAFLVTSAVDEATRPIMNEFEAAAARREAHLRSLQYLSPAIVLHHCFNDVAGASGAHHRGYMAQAKAFKGAYAKQTKDDVLLGRRLRSAEFASLPAFRFEQDGLESLTSRRLRELLSLALAAVVLAALADRRLHRQRPHSG